MRSLSRTVVRFWRVVALLIVVAAVLPLAEGALRETPSVSAQGEDGVVVRTTDNVRLRAAPSTASRIYDVARRGTQLTATAISSNYRWIRVTFHGQGGWMARRYLTVVSGDVAALPVSDEYVPPAVVSASQYMPVNAVVVEALQDVHMRTEPTAEPEGIEGLLNPNENVITVMPAGAQGSARAITVDGLWVFVQWSGYRGWIKGQYLNVVAGSLESLVPPNVEFDADGIYFVADRAYVLPGGCTMVRWAVEGSGSVNYKARRVASQGQREECPIQTQQYKLIVVRPGNQIIERTITIAVVTANVTFTATPDTVGRGGCTTLAWNTTAVSRVFLGENEVSVNGSQQVCPQETTNYALRAYTEDGNLIEQSVTVTVIEVTPTPSQFVTINFYADRLLINQGECVNVFWNVSGALQVFFQGAQVSPLGSQQSCPTTTTTYALRVFTVDNRIIEQTVVVSVNP